MNNPVTATLIADFHPPADHRRKSLLRPRCASASWRGSFFKHDKYPAPLVGRQPAAASSAKIGSATARPARAHRGRRAASHQAQPAAAMCWPATRHARRPRARGHRQAPAPALLVSLSQRNRPRLAPRRAWFKAWTADRSAIFRPPGRCCLWRSGSSATSTDSLIIFERVPGPTLARVDLDAMTPRAARHAVSPGRPHPARDRAAGLLPFRRQGQQLDRPRRRRSSARSPILIDVDGIRQRRWIALGIRRLLKSMQENHAVFRRPIRYSLCTGLCADGRACIAKSTDDELESEPSHPKISAKIDASGGADARQRCPRNPIAGEAAG